MDMDVKIMTTAAIQPENETFVTGLKDLLKPSTREFYRQLTTEKVKVDPVKSHSLLRL